MAQYMTPREVGERWHCSPRHVRRLCASGRLRGMRIGLDAWRIPLAAVEAYEAANTSAPSNEAPKPEAPKEVHRPITIDGFALPADYSPVFPELWPGHEVAAKKKAASVRG